MNENNISTDLQKRAFCVALQKNNKTIKVDGDFPNEFSEVLKNASISWVNVIVDDIKADSERIATSLGFSSNLISALLTDKPSNYEDTDVELGIIMPAVSIKELDITINPLIILIKKGLVLTIHEKAVTRLVRFSRYADIFMKKIKQNIPWQDKLTLMLVRIINETNSKNFDYLREIEQQADWLVKYLMDPKTPRQKLGPEIYKMKHALIVYLDSLWVSFNVITNLREGDAMVLSDNEKLLEKISLLSGDVRNQISISEHMSEVLASGLEVLQTIYNNQLQMLNNRLALLVAWLTIIGTAVLVPNTLATIFGIPSISERFNWMIVILILTASTILAGLGSYWFVKSRGLLSRKL
ncbi:MAG: CorA family divalent cation transporter [Nanoarchaeota archaeon]|nr:CorA family divalent cation transporter [Nanoarchaeota archaeon]